jgi:hypothetical protein
MSDADPQLGLRRELPDSHFVNKERLWNLILDGGHSQNRVGHVGCPASNFLPSRKPSQQDI